MRHELYKTDTKGNLRVWRAEPCEFGTSYRTVTGIEGGAMVTSGWTACQPTNVGRLNERNEEAQCCFEIGALYTKKTGAGWSGHRSDALGKVGRHFEPMLAQKYAGWKKLGNTVVFSQPKLDGIRCIATAEGLYSRNGKPILGVPHIEFRLKAFFDKHPNIVLDGELYNHDLRDNFNEIVSIVRKAKPSDADAVKALGVQYHIYDTPSLDESFYSRWPRLMGFLLQHLDLHPGYNHYIKLVHTKMVQDSDTLDETYQGYLEDGYEGQMVRLDKPYENKRSKSLLKRKEFLDSEFEIVAIEEGNGNWAGFAKRVILKLADGRTFGAGLKGNQSYAKELLER